MMISKTKETSKVIKYIKVPIRILSRARDIYLKSLTGCGTNIAYGNSMGCPTPQMPSIQRSFSVNPTNTKFRTVDEDLPELIRMSSTRKITTINVTEGGAEQLQRSRSSPAAVLVGPTDCGPKVLVFGKIDEEREVDDEEDVDGTVGLLRPHRNQVYARSKGYAVVSKSKVV